MVSEFFGEIVTGQRRRCLVVFKPLNFVVSTCSNVKTTEVQSVSGGPDRSATPSRREGGPEIPCRTKERKGPKNRYLEGHRRDRERHVTAERLGGEGGDRRRRVSGNPMKKRVHLSSPR